MSSNIENITLPVAKTFNLSRRKQANIAQRGDILLKQGIWVYFLLLIFEGALRKWFLPGLSTPLLIIRDPLALWLVLSAWNRGLLSINLYIILMVAISVAGIYTAFFLGHGNLPVAIYGARITLFHFPLIFVIGKIFSREDVEKLGKMTLWLSVPMAVLITLQFYSPQSAWVNRGLEGNIGGAGFSGALGYFRPPATFSFTNGTSLFFGFVACFVFYFWLNSHKTNRLLLIASTLGLLAAIPLSISRSLFFSVIISLLFTLIAISRKPRYVWKMVVALVGGALALIVLSQSNFFQTATEAFSARMDIGNNAEGGVDGVLIDRYLGGLIGALTRSGDQPFFGHGMGMGTNVGSMLLTGENTFLISEGEWGRVIGELGPIMGVAVIFIRLGLSLKLAVECYRKLTLGDLLPWMLLSFGLLIIPQGGWSQPTSLGFCTLTAGLIVASIKRPSSKKRYNTK